ncbi:MAG: VWA domain-containing protein [Oscillospiraceae bacterium]|nr:VWA domain-containing protein [Oscillospiraceae bacterium]
MTDNNLTELVFILDRSGSMHGLEKDTIGGFNGMIEKQKTEDGKAFVTTILFDDKIETLHDRVNLQEIKTLTDKDYTVRGMTALLDAVGSTINHISNIHKYARPEDVPAHTMFIITTDGMENASREFSYAKIKSLIEEKKQLGWEFVFIGANIDAVTEGAKLGISAERSVDYLADSAGTNVLFDAMSASVSEMRSGKKLSNAWRKSIDADKKKRGK